MSSDWVDDLYEELRRQTIERALRKEHAEGEVEGLRDGFEMGRDAAGNEVHNNYDISYHEHNDYTHEEHNHYSLFGPDDGDGDRDGGAVIDEDKRDTLRTLGGAGLAALGIGGGVLAGAAAYDELTGEPQALNPEEYDLYISQIDEIESLASEYENSDTEGLNAIGDRLENESDNEDLRVGFKSSLTDDFIDVNTGKDLIKRYDLRQTTYERAINEVGDVTPQ